MNLWQELVSTALVGTGRKAPTLPASGAALEQQLAALRGAEPERALLGAAVTLHLYRQSGQLPATQGYPLPDPCEAEELPRCSEGAAQYLALMLKGEHQDILHEWLMTAGQLGLRAPEELLPALLEHGRTKQAPVQVTSLPVLGRRGRWLAGQNDAWEFAAEVEDAAAEALWQTSKSPTRRRLLRQLRQKDPARGLALLQSTWAQDSHNERADFIAELSWGRSMADEPFLEAALDDPRKEVRGAALEQLSYIPQSRLVQRMTARAERFLRFHQGRIEVTLPDRRDGDMERDGVEETIYNSNLGEKAGWLRQILKLVPPSHWSERWQKTPTELVALLGEEGYEWKELLLEGWKDAAYLHNDPEWCEAILTHYPGWTEILDVLPLAQREAFLLRLLEEAGDTPYRNPMILPLLMQHSTRWGNELTRAVLVSLGKYFSSNDTSIYWQLNTALKAFARRMAPAFVAEAERLLMPEVEKTPAWRRAFDEFLTVLQFRQQMLKEFTP